MLEIIQMENFKLYSFSNNHLEVQVQQEESLAALEAVDPAALPASAAVVVVDPGLVIPDLRLMGHPLAPVVDLAEVLEEAAVVLLLTL
jgi:hypothetical protein